MREDFIHFCVRQYLKANSWHLIAGQYPNGSDDELPPLNVMDPVLARDQSPDHRRHSLNKLVPDLVASKQNLMLLIEFKPSYYHPDELKLRELLDIRKNDLLFALHQLIKRGVKFTDSPENFILIPCLGFGGTPIFKRNPDFCYFQVDKSGSVLFFGNSHLVEI